MEAMDIGMPTLVTPGTSFYEKAQLHNIAIPVATKEDVYRAIVEAVRDKSGLREIGENASKYVKEHYEWHKVGEETVARYKEVLGI
jgi:glycosyltransferase involved in cell wall biosynthesis